MFEINLKTNFKYLLDYESFTLVAFNLSLYYHLKSKKITHYKNFIFWPDGIFTKFFYPKINKIPGRSVIKIFKNKQKIKKINVIGNLSNQDIFYLKKNFNFAKIMNEKLPIRPIKNLESIINKKYDNKTLIIITLPSPKQEQIAIYLNKINRNLKIICLGGGLEMMSNKKKKPSKFVEKYFEFLWRLKSDTSRRLIRLLRSLLYIFYLVLNKDMKVRLKNL